jgi:hypothetical protein
MITPTIIQVSICLEDFKDAEETFTDCEIFTTRFNTDTYNENIEAREFCDFDCAYGSPNKIKNIKIGDPLYMIEMNNETNRIEGIGHIHNKSLKYPPKIYRPSYDDCNTYVYTGDHHITREDIYRLFPDIIDKLENKLFKGKGNQKRGKGFSRLSAKIYSETFTESDLASAIKQTFIHKYFRSV